MQETNPENLERTYGEFADAHAKYLEDIGFRKNLDKVIRPLLTVFDKVRISVDGDCTYHKIIETENLKDKVELFFDLAHMLKNVLKTVTKILTENNHNGDANGKIGNVNKFRLVNYIKNTMIKVTKIHRETENKDDAKILVKDAWLTMKNHCLGNHDGCEEEGKNCRDEPVFRTYGEKYTQSDLDALVADIFDKWLLSDTVYEKLENFGNTSNLESFHSIYTNRGLWTKSGSLHTATPKFDGITAVASTLYNFGDRETARKMMNLVGWKVLEGNLNALDRAEKNRDKRAAAKITQKAETKLNRIKSQKQYQNNTKWRDLNPYVPSNVSTQNLVDSLNSESTPKPKSKASKPSKSRKKCKK